MNFTLGKPFVSQSRSGPQSIFSWLIHSWLLDSYILLSHFHDFSKWSKLNKGSIIKYFLTELSGTRWRNIWLWVISHRPQSPAHPDEPYHGLHTSAPLVLDYLINLEGLSGTRQYLLKPEKTTLEFISFLWKLKSLTKPNIVDRLPGKSDWASPARTAILSRSLVLNSVASYSTTHKRLKTVTACSPWKNCESPKYILWQ